VDAIKSAQCFKYSLFIRALIYLKNKIEKGNLSKKILRKNMGEFYLEKSSLMEAQTLTALFPGLGHMPDTEGLFYFCGNDPSETAYWTRWNEFSMHLGRVLLKVDRATMHHSLEARVPLLDKEVIEFAAKMDWRSCLDMISKTGKLPLRQKHSARFSTQRKEKMGFSFSLRPWLMGSCKDMFFDLVLNRKDFFGYPMKRTAARNLFSRLEKGSPKAEWEAWTLLSLALWEKKQWKK
jgi:asparagine synthase (glutamine-hydrolysing)